VQVALPPRGASAAPAGRPAVGSCSGSAAAAHAPLAVVLNVGFASAKGGMLRGMLYPTKHRVGFTSDALRFILLMFVIGLLFYLWSVVMLVEMGASVSAAIAG